MLTRSQSKEKKDEDLDPHLVKSFRNIIQKQEASIAELREKNEQLLKENKKLRDYMAEVLLLTLQNRNEIFSHSQEFP